MALIRLRRPQSAIGLARRRSIFLPECDLGVTPRKLGQVTILNMQFELEDYYEEVESRMEACLLGSTAYLQTEDELDATITNLQFDLVSVPR